MKNNALTIFLLSATLIFLIFRPIFFQHAFIGGDWPYYFNEYLAAFHLPQIWNSVWPEGLGGNQAIILPLKLYLHLVVIVFVKTLGLPWEFVAKVFFFWMFVALALFSSFKLTKSFIGSLIYTTNTWILMVFSGGQMGIALAYAVLPLVLKVTRDGLSLLNNNKTSFLQLMKKSLLLGLTFSIVYLFDQRLGLISSTIVLLYLVVTLLFECIKKKNIISSLIWKQIIFVLFVPNIVLILLHAFWILPSIFIALRGGNITSIIDRSSASFSFLSFATYENALSLFHPNWPENVFGKVGFMRWEFLFLPLITFSSLFFIRNKVDKFVGRKATTISVLFFVSLGLIGAFLAKGANEPFGQLNGWLFDHVPGLNLFRDPVKFYILIALSYAFTIPHSISSISEYLKTKNTFLRKIGAIFPILFLILWVYLLSPFVKGSQVGIFKKREIPNDYVQFKNFLVGQSDFFRTLWFPSHQRFGYTSDDHPAISARDLFKEVSNSAELTKPAVHALLSDMSVKYIIIPEDSEEEIFLSDRRYDERTYKKYVDEFSKIPWVTPIKSFHKIIVYEVDRAKSHFFMQVSGETVPFRKESSTEYSLENVKNDGVLVFSEQYDVNWYAEYPNGKKIYSLPFKNKLNSFRLPKSGMSVVILYEPQVWVNIGYIISLATLILTGLFILYFRKETKNR